MLSLPMFILDSGQIFLSQCCKDVKAVEPFPDGDCLACGSRSLSAESLVDGSGAVTGRPVCGRADPMSVVVEEECTGPPKLVDWLSAGCLGHSRSLDLVVFFFLFAVPLLLPFSSVELHE